MAMQKLVQPGFCVPEDVRKFLPKAQKAIILSLMKERKPKVLL